VEVRPLKIGDESDGMTIVKSGLDVGEQVVTTNQYRLQAGVHIQEASAAPADKTAAAKAT
jgi:hypothetical protein